MDRTAAAALRHIEKMEERIEVQTTLVSELKKAGEDTFGAARRLALLEHALTEMRLLLGDMLPTETKERLRAAQ